MANTRQTALASLATVLLCWIVLPAAAQTDDDGLAGFIPAEAIFFGERRGHAAVRKAFQASNFGKMAADESIKQFVHETRIRVGQRIVKSMFNLETGDEIAAHQKVLHEFLKPFWWNAAAVCLIPDKNLDNEPGVVFICATGKYQGGCKEALAKLMKIGVARAGQPGQKQAFTYRTGPTVWSGLVEASSPLPADPVKQAEALKGKTVFMASWFNDVLLISTKLHSAEAVGRMFSLAKPAKGKNTDKNFRVVAGKTAIKEWAFRWYVDMEAIWRLLGKEIPTEIRPLGLHQIRGVGGTGGYADNVYTRRTYIYSPAVPGGAFAMFKRGGAYRKAISMVPDTAAIFLAGQFDMKQILSMIRGVAGIAGAGGRQATTGPAKDERKELAEWLKHFDKLAEASNGHVGLFLTNIPGMAAGPMMGGGFPVGAVIDITDHDKAVEAIDALVKLGGGDAPAATGPAVGPGALPRPKQYRKVPIRHIGRMVQMAVMKDRAIIALSDDALRSAIEAALDKTSGFAPDGKGAGLAALAGEGTAVFKLDLAKLAGVFWPFLMQMAQSSPEEFPLASMPSAAKLVRLLGPEVVVIAPDDDGLLLKARGKIPLSTKVMLMAPVLPLLMFAWSF